LENLVHEITKLINEYKEGECNENKQNNKKQPKYNLNQMLRVKSIGLVLPVKVTKRIERTERNLDTGEEQAVFLYDFKFEHEKPLVWYEVPEENLDEMVYLALMEITNKVTY
jgi:hypothetical protein